MTKVSEVSFGRIYTSNGLKYLKQQDVNIKKAADKTAKMLRENGLHKTKYVDIILEHDSYKGFYGIISSKEQGTPYNPSATSPKITPKTLSDVKEWLLGWEEAYSPKGLSEWKKLNTLAQRVINTSSKKV